MKQTSLTAVLAAGVLCFALQAGAAEVTNEWFSVDFTTAMDTKWTQSDEDDSAIVTAEIPSGGKHAAALKLETNGEELVYTPDASSGSVKTVLEMQVYLVGSDEVPQIADGAQTAVYLDTQDDTVSVLKAYVAGEWVALADNVAPGWHDVTIIMDYSDVQKAFFELDGSPVGRSTGYETGSSATAVASLGFKGSGYIDNFVGNSVIDAPPFYDDEGEGEGETTIASVDGVNKTVTFNTDKSGDALKFIRVYTSETEYKTLRYTDLATVNYDGAVKVVAYYGNSVSNVDTDDAPAAAVSLEGDTATVSVGNVKSGLYYGLYMLDGDSSVCVDSFLAGIDDDGKPSAFDQTITASSDDWGVVKFCVKASDDAPGVSK